MSLGCAAKAFAFCRGLAATFFASFLAKNGIRLVARFNGCFSRSNCKITVNRFF
jgi:hypothetical protein